MEPFKAIKSHFEGFGAFWSYLELFGAILSHVGQFGAIRRDLELNGDILVIWIDFEQVGATWS